MSADFLPLDEARALESERRALLQPASEIAPVPIRWLWPGWLAGGKLHILGGAPGTGKTTIAMALAAAITTGGTWPDGKGATKGRVLIWSAEDDPADTLVPRLTLAGADLSRVSFISGVRDATGEGVFDPARDIDALRRTIGRDRDWRLLIVDPIVSAIAGDSHKNAEVRRNLQPLVDTAAEVGCAVVGITHFTKGTSGRDPLERITGSLAFGALARIVLVAAKRQAEEGDGGDRVFLRAKSNIGQDDGGFAYDLVNGELPTCPGVFSSFVQWREPLQGSARDILAKAEAAPVEDAGNSAVGEAERFLRGTLANGPLPSTEVYERAAAAGVSQATVRRAQKNIGVKSSKGGVAGSWMLSLPPKKPGFSQGAQDAQPKSLSALSILSTLSTFDPDAPEIWEV